MLVLTRKSEQKIRIGKNIVITILKIQGEQVSIGIDAPKETPIVREELVKHSEEGDAPLGKKELAGVAACCTTKT